MRKYNYERVQEMLNPLFEFMRAEYPNDYCLVIKSDSAELFYNKSQMIFLSDEISEIYGFSKEADDNRENNS